MPKKTDGNVADLKIFELEGIKNAYYSMYKMATKDKPIISIWMTIFIFCLILELDKL